MVTKLRTQDERSCELWERAEVWNEAEGTWRVADGDDGPVVGSLHCIHEWDING